MAGITASSGTIAYTTATTVDFITLSGTAVVTMTGAVLTVTGNITLSGGSRITITGGGLTVPQTISQQYSISLVDTAKLELKTSEMITSGNGMYNGITISASGNATVNSDTATLRPNNGSWCLFTFGGNARLNMNGSNQFPTEVYPSGAVRAVISNSNLATIYLNFQSGSNGTVTVPRKDAQGRFNFTFGNSLGFDYLLTLTNANTRIGVETRPGSTAIVQGTGNVLDASVQFSYYIQNNMVPITLDGLPVGVVTKDFTDSGRLLSLRNVYLGAIGTWDVYVSGSNGFPTTITNSLLNEISATTATPGGGGLMNFIGGTLQYAEFVAGGPGSIINVSGGADIWSQGIRAKSQGKINIDGSTLHGNVIAATGAGSVIAITNSADLKNGTQPTCAGNPNNNGVPLCNPLNPLQKCSTVVLLNGGVVTGLPACS